MNADQIMDALGELDLSVLAECETYAAQRIKRRKMIQRTAAGICAVLALAVGIRVLPVFEHAMESSDGAAAEMEDAAVTTMPSMAPTETADNTDTVHDGSMDAVEDAPVYSYTEDVYGSVSDSSKADIAPEADDDAVCEEPPVVEEAIEFPVEEAPAADDVIEKEDQIETETTAGHLPLLSVSLDNGGMGFEGILLYEDDVHCSAPLLATYRAPKKLGVYRNLAYTEQSDKSVYLTDDEMLALAKTYADALSFTVESYETSYLGEIEDIPGDVVMLMTDGGEIRVMGNGNISITLNDAVSLPDGLSLRDDTDLAAAEQTVLYLTERFDAILPDDVYQPMIVTDRTIDGEPNRRYSAYPIGKTDAEQFLDQSFASVFFSGGEDGDTVDTIHIENRQLSVEEVGQYPLISEGNAMNQLIKGYYLTTVPEEYYDEYGVSEDRVLSCDLEYHVGNTDAYYIPYYHFYVEIEASENAADGLRAYGGFWVPAVHPDYLDPDTVWDGRFN